MSASASDDSLLEENGAKPGVESADALVLEHLAEAANEAIGVGGLGDEADTGSLEGAQGNVGKELCSCRRGKIDGGAIVRGGFVAECVDALLLEELVAAKLEGALEEVAGKGGADAGEEGAGALVLDYLAEAADQAAVVRLGVELDASLDAGAWVSKGGIR